MDRRQGSCFVVFNIFASSCVTQLALLQQVFLGFPAFHVCLPFCSFVQPRDLLLSAIVLVSCVVYLEFVRRYRNFSLSSLEFA